MVKLLPDLEYPTGNQFDKSETLWLAFSSYFCALAFTVLLVLTFYNIIMYLIRDGKWRVYSLTMFYILAVLCLVFRIIVNILAVLIAQNFYITLTLFAAVIKFDIGIVQIEVIIEIIIRVRESMNAAAVLSKGSRKKPVNMINDIIASRKRADRWVHVM